MAERKTLVNKAGREVYVDSAEAEESFRAKGYFVKGEKPAEVEPKEPTGKGKGEK